MALTPADLQSVVFSKPRRGEPGYCEAEVDTLLGRVEEELDRQIGEQNELRKMIAVMRDRAVRCEEAEAELHRWADELRLRAAQLDHQKAELRQREAALTRRAMQLRKQDAALQHKAAEARQIALNSGAPVHRPSRDRARRELPVTDGT